MFSVSIAILMLPKPSTFITSTSLLKASTADVSSAQKFVQVGLNTWPLSYD